MPLVLRASDKRTVQDCPSCTQAPLWKGRPDHGNLIALFLLLFLFHLLRQTPLFTLCVKLGISRTTSSRGHSLTPSPFDE